MKASATATYQFGTFFFETRTLVLRQGHEIVPLKHQSAAVLGLLVQQAGDIVTREVIKNSIWHDRTIEFDHGINACIRDIRRVLGDNPKDPRFIETVPKVGYRFLGDVVRPAVRVRKVRAYQFLAATLAIILVAVLLFSANKAPGGENAPQALRLAVMPFRAVAVALDGEDILDAMTALAVSELSERQTVLQVISAGELFDDADRQPGMGDVSRWLEVDYLIAGAVRQEEGTLFLNLRLIRTDGYVHLWSKSKALSHTNDMHVLRQLLSELLLVLPTAPALE